ncbi:MAG: hypothetical protein HZB26_13125, partial [Candidatus Hydrogenedentes bacterium]|nr:hypothetical protein [Candidatus Hydrogenedentota bacterium]
MTDSEKAGTRRIALGVMGLVYVIWGGVFIWENSVVAIDGRRYFVLFDDAMISMRYAWNLAHGVGLVWNAGERVEGITNLLMTLYMALPSLVLGKIAAVVFVEVSGVAFLIAMGLLCMRIARQVMGEKDAPYREFVATAAFLAPLAYYPLAFWTVLGMETGLLTLLLLWAVWLVLRDEGIEDPPWLLGVTLGLMFLTRPDAVIPMGLILAYRASGARGSSSKLRSVAFAAGCAAGFVILLTVFRWIYYGSPVPNTYTLKVTGMPLLFRIENGWGFLLPFFGTIWVPVLIALLGLLTQWRKSALLLFALFAA